jgi:hypothetical protein
MNKGFFKKNYDGQKTNLVTTYYPHWKISHNLKVWNLKFLHLAHSLVLQTKNQFYKNRHHACVMGCDGDGTPWGSFDTRKWGVMWMPYQKKMFYNTKKNLNIILIIVNFYINVQFFKIILMNMENL